MFREFIAAFRTANPLYPAVTVSEDTSIRSILKNIATLLSDTGLGKEFKAYLALMG